MIQLPVKQLKPGMVTSQSVYNTKGASYLTRGTPITQQYIDRLRKLGIKALSVTSLNPSFQLLPPEDIVQEKTRVVAIHRVTEAFDDIIVSNTLNIEPLEQVAETILFDLFKQRSNLVQMTDLRLYDSYTFAHCVNVAILSAMIGSFCHLSKKDMLDLVLGSMLHDIGKVNVPLEILNKPSSLSPDEFDVVKQHPEIGRMKLKEIHAFDNIIPLTIVSQHHEHLDGTGYPHNLEGSSIHKFARIVAVADVYDALTSDRPYKKAYKPHIAYKIMTSCCKGQFDEDMLNIFFNNVALYPVGTIIKTIYGYAIVKECEYGRTQVPLICVFADHNAKVLEKPYVLNTAECPRNCIEQVIEDKDLFPLLFRMRVDPAQFLQD